MKLYKREKCPKELLQQSKKIKEICSKSPSKGWCQMLEKKSCPKLVQGKANKPWTRANAQTFFLILGYLQLLLNCDSYFPLKVKVNGKNIFYMPRAIFLTQFGPSNNPEKLLILHVISKRGISAWDCTEC